MTDQYKLTGIVCARPQQFAWFLGAGASAAAGLPTAWDIIWDLKRRYYRREESQDISRQDMQLDAVRARVQSYILSQGFPEEGTRANTLPISRRHSETIRRGSANIWRRLFQKRTSHFR